MFICVIYILACRDFPYHLHSLKRDIFLLSSFNNVSATIQCLKPRHVVKSSRKLPYKKCQVEKVKQDGFYHGLSRKKARCYC